MKTSFGARINFYSENYAYSKGLTKSKKIELVRSNDGKVTYDGKIIGTSSTVKKLKNIRISNSKEIVKTLSEGVLAEKSDLKPTLKDRVKSVFGKESSNQKELGEFYKNKDEYKKLIKENPEPRSGGTKRILEHPKNDIPLHIYFYEKSKGFFDLLRH